LLIDRSDIIPGIFPADCCDDDDVLDWSRDPPPIVSDGCDDDDDEDDEDDEDDDDLPTFPGLGAGVCPPPRKNDILSLSFLWRTASCPGGGGGGTRRRLEKGSASAK